MIESLLPHLKNCELPENWTMVHSNWASHRMLPPMFDALIEKFGGKNQTISIGGNRSEISKIIQLW